MPYRCLLYIKRGHAITFLGKRLLSGCLRPRSGSSGQAWGGGRAKQLLPAGQRHRLPPSCCRPPGLPVLTRVQGSGPQADLLLSGQKHCLAELQLITCLCTALSQWSHPGGGRRVPPRVTCPRCVGASEKEEELLSGGICLVSESLERPRLTSGQKSFFILATGASPSLFIQDSTCGDVHSIDV